MPTGGNRDEYVQLEEGSGGNATGDFWDRCNCCLSLLLIIAFLAAFLTTVIYIIEVIYFYATSGGKICSEHTARGMCDAILKNQQ